MRRRTELSDIEQESLDDARADTKCSTATNVLAAIDAMATPEGLLQEIAQVVDGKLAPGNRELLGYLAEYVAWCLEFHHVSAPSHYTRLAGHIDREIRRTAADRNKLARAA